MNFIDKIDIIYQNNKDIDIYIDMDGTIVEFLLNNEMDYMKVGEYLKKRPICPIINIIEKIKKKYPLITLKILSCSSTNQMKKEKNDWLDEYMPYICRENRVIFSRENGDFSDKTINTVKSAYLSKQNDSKVIFLVDDDVRVLIEVQKLLKNNIVPVHVTSLLIE